MKPDKALQSHPVESQMSNEQIAAILKSLREPYG
jgi:hypothetical protein